MGLLVVAGGRSRRLDRGQGEELDIDRGQEEGEEVAGVEVGTDFAPGSGPGPIPTTPTAGVGPGRVQTWPALGRPGQDRPHQI